MIEDFKRKMEKNKEEAAALNKLISLLNNAINDIVNKEQSAKKGGKA